MYDIPSDTWSSHKSFSSPLLRIMTSLYCFFAVTGTAGFGEGIGGGNALNPVLKPEIYDIPSDTWSGPMAAAVRPRLYHSTAILLTSGEVSHCASLLACVEFWEEMPGEVCVNIGDSRGMSGCMHAP